MVESTRRLPPCKPLTKEAPCQCGLVDPGSHESLLAELNDLLQLHCNRLGKYIDGRMAEHQEVLLRRMSEHGLAEPPLNSRCPPVCSGNSLEASDLEWERGASESFTLDGPNPDDPEETADHRSVLVSFSREDLMNKGKSRAAQSVDSAESDTTTGSPHSLGQSISQRLVESTKFEALVCTIIIANVVLLGVEVEVTIESYHSPLVFKVAELAFAALFASEIAIRINAHGFRTFVSGEHRAWNFFDVVLVSAALFQALISFFEDVVIPNIVATRLLRIFRMVRVFRIIRIMQFFRPLRILVSSLVVTFKSLGWALMLLLMFIYLFGMLFTMAVSDAMSRPGAEHVDLADAQKHFGSLWRSCMSLFKAMSSGMDWDVYHASLFGVGTMWSLLFALFIAFSQIALLNVITGIMCQGAIESAHQDQDVVVEAHLAMKERYVSQLMAIFRDIDADGSGSISLQEFEDRLQDPALQSYFAAMDLTMEEAWNVFKLLDTSKSCFIKPDDFVSGCLKLKGTARSQDVHMLMYESSWMRRRVDDLAAAVDGLASKLRSPPGGGKWRRRAYQASENEACSDA